MATLCDDLAAEETGIREISDRPSRDISSSGPVRLTTIERSCFPAMSESITGGQGNMVAQGAYLREYSL